MKMVPRSARIWRSQLKAERRFMKFASLIRFRHIYEIRPRTDKHGFDLRSDALRFSPLCYRGSNPIVDAVGYARAYSRSHPVLIRIYDPTGNLLETLEYGGWFKGFFLRQKIAAASKFLLVVQRRRTFDKLARSISKTLEKCSRWFEGFQNRLIAGIVADLPRFSEGINRQCFSHYGRF